ncbi:extracellular solute-binding protein [Clostridium sp.]|jgi:multiple sugar transport system substrate-binding protein|uniref:extracellular solute-binding protein n=2 Tax=Clostridium TaxID=1485 RepID=UPI0025BB4603|nr:extracellular solute-binding protein [Clostridium sp.]MCI9070441.1 extracellular solute-binding protein [Clostridium sp.]MCI9304484.1 extracellular solute-binding protein [Clostridium sp.]
MKRRLLASLMTAILAVTALTGCSKDNSSNDNIVTELKEPVTIEMWHYMNGKQAEVLQSIVDDFNNSNTQGITVKALAQGSIPDLNKKVIAASQSNTLPAIVNVYPDAATGLINDNKVADLTPYVNNETVGMKDAIKDDFIPDFIKELSQWGENKIYGLPMTKSTEVLYVNKNLLEQLGYTVEDLKDLDFKKLAEISEKCQSQLGIPGFGFDSPSNAFISSLKEDGKDFVQLDGKINVVNDWSKEFMQFFRNETQKGAFRVPGEDKFLSGPFSNQKLLAYQGSSAGFAHINTNGAFEVAIVEVPHFEGKSKAVIQQGASLFVTKDVPAEAQYAAYEFIKFATNTENTAKFSTATGYLPVRKSAQDSTLVQELVSDSNSLYGKIYEVAKDSLSFAYFTPAVNNAQSARTVADEKFSAYVTGNSDDVDAMLEEMKVQVETSISRQ